MMPHHFKYLQIAIGAIVSLGLIVAFVWGVQRYLRRHERRDGGSETTVDDSFEAHIPEYAAKILAWFDSEHPYFDQSFVLTDVQRVVPLNRTYLSRIFNEGIGESFNDLVRDCRMAEARRLLAEKPDMPIADIAEHCGFAGHSSFHRSFVRTEGITPREFRLWAMAKEEKNGETGEI